jgi:hypothetical protein
MLNLHHRIGSVSTRRVLTSCGRTTLALKKDCTLVAVIVLSWIIVPSAWRIQQLMLFSTDSILG